jgi:hypothetical protein
VSCLMRTEDEWRRLTTDEIAGDQKATGRERHRDGRAVLR